MSLTGSAQGATRAAIVEHAKDAAVKYFDTTCIGVTLSKEQAVTLTETSVNGRSETMVTGYEADWSADIAHNYWEGAYGRTECRYCKARPA